MKKNRQLNPECKLTPTWPGSVSKASVQRVMKNVLWTLQDKCVTTAHRCIEKGTFGKNQRDAATAPFVRVAEYNFLSRGNFLYWAVCGQEKRPCLATVTCRRPFLWVTRRQEAKTENEPLVSLLTVENDQVLISTDMSPPSWIDLNLLDYSAWRALQARNFTKKYATLDFLKTDLQRK